MSGMGHQCYAGLHFLAQKVDYATVKLSTITAAIHDPQPNYIPKYFNLISK